MSRLGHEKSKRLERLREMMDEGNDVNGGHKKSAYPVGLCALSVFRMCLSEDVDV